MSRRSWRRRAIRTARSGAWSASISTSATRKRAEMLLNESEARLRAAIESLPFDFWICDAAGRYVMNNATCREHWGSHLGQSPTESDVDPEVTRAWAETNDAGPERPRRFATRQPTAAADQARGRGDPGAGAGGWPRYRVGRREHRHHRAQACRGANAASGRPRCADRAAQPTQVPGPSGACDQPQPAAR